MTGPHADAARATAEAVARQGYGRLVAWLAWQWRDLAAAQDALSQALLAALTHWPVQGVPASPEAWLLKTAQRELLQQHRRQRLACSPQVQALLELDPAAPAAPVLPDRRLELLFACAHPALAPAMHAPLMLQAVLGLDASTIARACLVAPATMAQRLVRAKARLRTAGVRFETPEARELPARLAAVLEGIYGAYTVGSDFASPAPEAEPGLRDEAVFLARLLVARLPDGADAAEPLGLLALLLHAEARRPALFDAQGRFVPLALQDVRLWQAPLAQEAEACLWHAARLGRPGPLQLEAAIHSAHSQRLHGGPAPWPQIARLYSALVAHSGRLGAHIGHAVALAESGQVGAGLQVLTGLDAAAVRSHQPYWVALAHLQRLQGLPADAALQRALGLTADERVRRHLRDTPSAHTVPPTPA